MHIKCPQMLLLQSCTRKIHKRVARCSCRSTRLVVVYLVSNCGADNDSRLIDPSSSIHEIYEDVPIQTTDIDSELISTPNPSSPIYVINQDVLVHTTIILSCINVYEAMNLVG